MDDWFTGKKRSSVGLPRQDQTREESRIVKNQHIVEVQETQCDTCSLSLT